MGLCCCGCGCVVTVVVVVVVVVVVGGRLGCVGWGGLLAVS